MTLLLAAAFVAGTSSGCAGGDEGAPPPSQTEEAGVEIDEDHARASLDELGAASDEIIWGTVQAVETGFDMPNDPSGQFRVYEIEVQEADIANPGEFVRVAVSESMGDVPISVPGQPELHEDDEAVWALTQVDDMFEFDGYVLTSSQSIFPPESDGAAQASGELQPSRIEAAALNSEETFRELMTSR